MCEIENTSGVLFIFSPIFFYQTTFIVFLNMNKVYILFMYNSVSLMYSYYDILSLTRTPHMHGKSQVYLPRMDKNTATHIPHLAIRYTVYRMRYCGLQTAGCRITFSMHQGGGMWTGVSGDIILANFRIVKPYYCILYLPDKKWILKFTFVSNRKCSFYFSPILSFTRHYYCFSKHE